LVRFDAKAFQWKPVSIEPDGAVTEPGCSTDVPGIRRNEQYFFRMTAQSIRSHLIRFWRCLETFYGIDA